MLVWCKMFRQTLGGSARNWFDDLDPKSVDGFEELTRKFLEELTQQKKNAKDPTEIHGIKQNPPKESRHLSIVSRLKVRTSNGYLRYGEYLLSCIGMGTQS